MQKKLIAFKVAARIGYENLKSIFAGLAAGARSVERFLLDPETGVLLERLGAVKIKGSTRDGVIVEASNPATTMDAHYHPEGQLDLSLADTATMQEANLPGIIIYSDNGVFAVHPNKARRIELNLDVRELLYGYCNIKRVIGRGISQIIGEDNARNQLVLDRLEGEISEIDRAMQEFCGKGQAPDADNITHNIREWVKVRFPLHYQDLTIDDHMISHGIEDFMEKGLAPESFMDNSEIFARCIASRILSEKKDYVFGEDPDLVSLENALIAEIAASLKKGRKNSYIDTLSAQLIDIHEKAVAISDQLGADLSAHKLSTTKTAGKYQVHTHGGNTHVHNG